YCGGREIAASQLRLKSLDADGTMTCQWSAGEAGVFIVEESASPDPEAGEEIYRGSEAELTMYGRPPGIYYYRARLQVGRRSSDWSASLTVVVAPPGAFEMDDESTYSDATLIAVQ